MNWQLFHHYLQGFYRIFLYIMIYMYVYIYTYIPRRNKQLSLHTYVYNPSHVNSFQKRNCQVSSFPQLSGQRFNQKWNHHLVRLHHSTTTLLWNPSFWKARYTFNNHHLQTTWPRPGTPSLPNQRTRVLLEWYHCRAWEHPKSASVVARHWPSTPSVAKSCNALMVKL